MQTVYYPKNNFDIEATLTCGQVFRYEKVGEGAYVVYSKGHRCELKDNGENIEIRTDVPAYFENYFDLSTDYGSIVSTLMGFEELREAVEYGKGIRILRQDPEETVFSFIVSANNNIKRIQGIIARLCERYGDKKDGYYAFPSAEQLQRATVSELKEIGLGYRAQYIYDTARTLPGVIEKIRSAKTADEARKILLTQKGIGPKVADCIVLFGLHLTRSYPVDTWIFKANATETLNTPQRVHEHFISRYGDNAGFAQQYIFHYARNARER